jgi:hypothetical protein
MQRLEKFQLGRKPHNEYCNFEATYFIDYVGCFARRLMGIYTINLLLYRVLRELQVLGW